MRSTASPKGKVAIVVGGGAVAGDIFASPSTHLAVNVCRKADHGGGVILGFGKYAGDVFNFGLAAERLISEGIEVRLLPVTDDVASAPPEKANERRGVAGDLSVFKIAGATAEATAQLTPKLDRVKSHTQRSLGYPDAGAVSLALCARVVAEAIKGDTAAGIAGDTKASREAWQVEVGSSPAV
ncbi:hypothetical protein AGMMS50256_08620 [Betaproteobacteria bacterium]|nr:hypothetical protein AGMMS50256_08620 [Betaproteobacteria bacterium]